MAKRKTYRGKMAPDERGPSLVDLGTTSQEMAQWRNLRADHEARE
jgi:hypothetical protein